MPLISGFISVLIYLALAVCLINFIIGIFYSKTRKSLYKVLCFSTIGLLLAIFIFQCKESHDVDFEHTGEYDLIKYPDCNNCRFILSIDNKFKVISNNNTIESGIWEQEESSDAGLVYLNNGKDILGSGNYEYNVFKQTKP